MDDTGEVCWSLGVDEAPVTLGVVIATRFRHSRLALHFRHSSTLHCKLADILPTVMFGGDAAVFFNAFNLMDHVASAIPPYNI